MTTYCNAPMRLNREQMTAVLRMEDEQFAQFVAELARLRIQVQTASTHHRLVLAYGVAA